MPSFTSSFSALAALLLAGSQLAAAHMDISYPAPFRSKHNPHATNIDYSMTAPLSSDGSNYPCKGYHSDFGTPAGAPTASFAAGGTFNFTVSGSASHGGGSCQVSLSYDNGATFKVIQSYIGGCPLASSYDFTVPADAPAGDAIWAWTWQNQIGNREFYMNCAAVTITGSGKRDVVDKRESFSARPGIFLANVGNGCTTVEGADVAYPDPGPDVVNGGGKTAPPSGNCGAAAAPGAGAGTPTSSKSQAPVAPAPTTSAVASKPTIPGGVFITIATSSASASATAAPSTTSVTEASSTAEAPKPAPTTLQTSAKTTSASIPTSTSGSGSGSAPVSGTNTGPCTNEGAWNCIGGKAFQRCASGQWSAVISMAAGTSCTPGTSDTLGMVAGRRSMRVRR